MGLSERYQAVRVNSSVSSFKLIGTGVPQGSVLGPILYLIYVNDLPYVTKIIILVPCLGKMWSLQHTMLVM